VGGLDKQGAVCYNTFVRIRRVKIRPFGWGFGVGTAEGGFFEGIP